jgi:hypothetical protein
MNAVSIFQELKASSYKILIDIDKYVNTTSNNWKELFTTRQVVNGISILRCCDEKSQALSSLRPEVF